MRQAGERVGPFELVEAITLGDRRERWRAIQVDQRRPVTLWRADWLDDEPARAAALTALSTLRDAVDESLVPIDGIDCFDGACWAWTEPFSGSPLKDSLPRGGFEGASLLDHARRLSQALAAAHAAGLSHRELNPDSLWQLDDGRLRIHGCGLSGTAEGVDEAVEPDEAPTITMTYDGADGQAAFLAPEQIKDLPLDARTDVYSIGALLYWLATGRPPFRGESQADILVAVLCDTHRPATDLKHDVPPELASAIDRCLSKERSDRFSSAEELSAVIEAITL